MQCFILAKKGKMDIVEKSFKPKAENVSGYV